MLFAFHETSTHAATVLVTDFVDLDGIVTAVEGNDKGTAFIIGFSGHKLGVESKDMHVLLEHLLHIEFRNLWLESDDASHGVFFSAVAS